MVNSHPIYSHYFSTIYDEQTPIGKLGRGTHYSVFRCVERADVTLEPVQHNAEVHDFAVIWDEDHDTRIIELIERIYMRGLMSPIQFIGERKGMVTIILAARFCTYGKDVEAYKSQVSEIVDSLEFDSWTVDFGIFDRNSFGVNQNDACRIICDEEKRVQLYLHNINSLWSLGTKSYTHTYIGEPSKFPPKLPGQ